MGVLDFAKGVGDAVKTGVTKVGDTVLDIGKDVGGSLKTLADMNIYAHNPQHWDDIVSGGVSAGKFIAEHPGTSAEIGRKVAFDIAKDSVTTPSGIATTALALASGGAGAAGKIATAAKAARGIKVAAEVGEIGKAVEGVSTAAKVVEGAEAASEASKVAEGISAATKPAKVSLADKALGAGIEVGEGGALQPTKLSKFRDPLKLAAGRTAAAERILAGAGEEAPSVGRQVLAGIVQGTSGTKPIQMTGMSDDVYRAQEAVWRVRAAGGKLQGAPGARKALKVAANPRQAAFDAAMSPQGKEVARGIVRDKVQQTFKQFEQPGGQQVMDFGQPKPAGYGGPGEQMQLPLEWPTPSTQGTFQPLEQPQAATPARITSSTRAADQRQQPLARSNVTAATKGGTAKGTPKAPLRGKKTLHAWQGPGREVFGGITPGFDWRDRNWGIERPHRNLSFANGAQTARGGDEDDETTISQGQQPKGSPEPNVKIADEPMDLSQPGTMSTAQFPTTKVVPGKSLQSGSGIDFSSGATPGQPAWKGALNSVEATHPSLVGPDYRKIQKVRDAILTAPGAPNSAENVALRRGARNPLGV